MFTLVLTRVYNIFILSAKHQRSEVNMLTIEQIEWAKQHDWFIKSLAPGVVRVHDVDDTHKPVKHFDNFNKLKTWAGY